LKTKGVSYETQNDFLSARDRLSVRGAVDRADDVDDNGHDNGHDEDEGFCRHQVEIDGKRVDEDTRQQ